MGKKHLDLSPLHERGHVGVGFANVAGDISCCFVNGSEHFPGGLVRATLRFQVASVAILFARSVADQTVLADIRGARLREFPAGRLESISGGARIPVGVRIVGKVAREKVPSVRFDLSQTGILSVVKGFGPVGGVI